MLGSTALLAMASSLGVASAASIPRQNTNTQPYGLLVGGPGYMRSLEFTGTQITDGVAYREQGFTPSWMLPSYKKNLLYTNSENANDTRVFDFEARVVPGQGPMAKVNGTAGVVSLGFNKDESRMLGGSYGNGGIDVWDTTPTDTIKLLKTLTITGPLAPSSTSHRAHEVVLDPSGQFFAVPDLGGDQIVLVDARDDKDYKLVDKTISTGSKTGPRHGKFISAGGAKEATHFALITENSNELILYTLKYTADTIEFTEAQRQSTFPKDVQQPNKTAPAPPAEYAPPAGGELLVFDNKHVYISNRRTGNDQDSIVSFKLDGDKLVYTGFILTGGTFPRSFDIQEEGTVLFVANQAGKNGIQVHARCSSTGVISKTPMATFDRSKLVEPYFSDADKLTAGPQFILALPRAAELVYPDPTTP